MMGHHRSDITDLPLRFWRVGSCLIVYSESDPIEIVPVLHGRRNVTAELAYKGAAAIPRPLMGAAHRWRYVGHRALDAAGPAGRAMSFTYRAGAWRSWKRRCARSSPPCAASELRSCDRSLGRLKLCTVTEIPVGY